MTTVVLEGRGDVPCEVVGEPRWHTVTVHADYGRPLPVRYALIRVVLEDGESRVVAVERVSGWRAPRPIAGSRSRPPGVQCKRGESHRVVVAGVQHKSLAAACRATGVNYRTARERVRAGYPAAVAVLRWER